MGPRVLGFKIYVAPSFTEGEEIRQQYLPAGGQVYRRYTLEPWNPRTLR